jgi:predicted MFS family arabinose efflux permease
MALTGICILWAARLFPEAPARGVTLSFLALGIGQTLGSPLAGAVADLTGLSLVFAGAAAISLVAAGSQLRFGSAPIQPPEDEPHELIATGWPRVPRA